jgi:thioredoxin 1
MTEFTTESNINTIIAEARPIIVIYYAKWCMPCKSISQTLSNLEPLFADEIAILAVNVDEFPIIALEHNVRAVPTLQYYKNGALYLKESGFRTKDQLVRNIEALLAISVVE